MEACDEYRKNLGVIGVDIKDYGKNSSWSLKDKSINRHEDKQQ